MKTTSIFSLVCIGFLYSLTIRSDIPPIENNKFYNPYYLSIQCLAHQSCYLTYKGDYVTDFHFFSYSFVFSLIENAKKNRAQIIYLSINHPINERLKPTKLPIKFKFSTIKKENFNYNRPSYIPFLSTVKFSINKNKDDFIWLTKEMFNFVVENKKSPEFLINEELFKHANDFNYLTINDFIKLPSHQSL